METRQEKSAYVEHFLKVHLPGMKNKHLEKKIKDLHNKPIKLVNETQVKQKKNKLTKIKPNRLIKLKNCKYSDYEPLRQLWKQYIGDLLSITNTKELDIKAAQETLLKADYHGATFHVAKSRCKSLVGVSGTVITESKCIFQIISKKDKVLKIPKKNCVFEVEFFGYLMTLFGDQFCIKPGYRLTKRFKKYVPNLHLA